MKFRILMENWKKFVLKENEDLEIPEMEDNFLYHGTSIKNAKDIEEGGLEPSFGPVVKGTEGYGYYMDDDYYDPYYRVEGTLFFSDDIDTWKYGSLRDGKLLGGNNVDEAALVIVENNDSIYRMLEDGVVIDYEGNQVDYVGDLPVDKLPPFIERNDFFSIEWQPAEDVLYGERLKAFLKKYGNL